MEEVTAQLFKPGPLHNKRHEIIENLNKLNIKTGDIFCRLGRSTFLGIPFEKLVARLTKSTYSHASVAYVNEYGIHLLEVNDQGTLLLRAIDWIDYCAAEDFAVYRIPLSDNQIQNVTKAIWDFVKIDPDYDFSFSEEDTFYCTESVAHIFDYAQIKLIQPVPMKKVLGLWYWIIYPFNYIIKKLTNVGLPMQNATYFVGNQNHGILAAKNIQKIYSFK